MTGFLFVSDRAWLVFCVFTAVVFWLMMILAVCRAAKDGQEPLPAPPPWIAPDQKEHPPW